MMISCCRNATRSILRAKQPVFSKLSNDGSKRIFSSSINPTTPWKSSPMKGAAAAATALVVAACKLADDEARRSKTTMMEAHESSVSGVQEQGTIGDIQHMLDDYISYSMWKNEYWLPMAQRFGFGDDEQRDEKGRVEQRTESRKVIHDEFPSLELRLLNDNCENFKLNSREPIPIENDFFSGRILIHLRPQNKDTENKERFEIQLQGKFKRKPNGTIYCGGELAERDFQCSMLTRGLANVLLKLLVRYIGPSLDYSFGGENGTGRGQLPHISFPLKTAMYNIIATPPGRAPPKMGEPFVETEESRALRKSSTDANDWSLDETYSMSFTSSSLDLPTWRVMYPWKANLSLFWGKAPLRLVIYEEQQGNDDNAQTAQDTNNYLLALEMTFLGKTQGTDNSLKKQNTVEGFRASSLV